MIALSGAMFLLLLLLLLLFSEFEIFWNNYTYNNLFLNFADLR